MSLFDCNLKVFIENKEQRRCKKCGWSCRRCRTCRPKKKEGFVGDRMSGRSALGGYMPRMTGRSPRPPTPLDLECDNRPVDGFCKLQTANCSLYSECDLTPVDGFCPSISCCTRDLRCAVTREPRIPTTIEYV